jgi:hypothetical protein
VKYIAVNDFEIDNFDIFANFGFFMVLELLFFIIASPLIFGFISLLMASTLVLILPPMFLYRLGIIRKIEFDLSANELNIFRAHASFHDCLKIIKNVCATSFRILKERLKGIRKNRFIEMPIKIEKETIINIDTITKISIEKKHALRGGHFTVMTLYSRDIDSGLFKYETRLKMADLDKIFGKVFSHYSKTVFSDERVSYSKDI